MIKEKKHFHFMGISGIGMSGIAKILIKQGHTISGCDLDYENKTIKELQNLGCKITFEHNSSICNQKSINYLVYTSDIKTTHLEIINAKKQNIIVIHRATLLAELMKQKFSLAIAGSHGKTTTSSMVAHILIEAKEDPTIIIGGYLKNISDNSRYGKGEFFVAETDESDKSIERMYPTYAIITNIDLEHLETYANIDEIKETFKNFINKLPFYGKAIICIDDAQIKSMLPLGVRTITYGIETQANFMAKNINIYSDHSVFEVIENNEFIGKINLNFPGKHNILNSLAAIATCLDLNISFEIIAEALKSFKGIERRFSFNGIYKNVEIFDDYGHHPNEIINTIQVAKKRAKNNLNIIFQPHRFSRTAKLWNDFVNAFSEYPVNNLIITDIFPKNEEPVNNITSFNLVKDIKKKNPLINVAYIPLDNDFQNIIQEINNFIQPNDLLLLLGAGKINKIAQKLLI